MPKSLTGTTVLRYDETADGLALMATFDGGTAPTTANVFAPGCRLLNKATGVVYKNTGTAASPSWNNEDEISAAEIADGAVTHKKHIVTEAVTSTADGTGTGQIDDDSTFVTVTSAAATNAVKLPAAASGYIGREIMIFVGANGYELITGADGDTINGTDADGTNQVDVAANTLIRAVQVSATGWYTFHHTGSALSVVAPDND